MRLKRYFFVCLSPFSPAVSNKPPFYCGHFFVRGAGLQRGHRLNPLIFRAKPVAALQQLAKPIFKTEIRYSCKIRNGAGYKREVAGKRNGSYLEIQNRTDVAFQLQTGAKFPVQFCGCFVIGKNRVVRSNDKAYVFRKFPLHSAVRGTARRWCSCRADISLFVQPFHTSRAGVAAAHSVERELVFF